jgi:hypothetical protein
MWKRPSPIQIRMHDPEHVKHESTSSGECTPSWTVKSSLSSRGSVPFTIEMGSTRSIRCVRVEGDKKEEERDREREAENFREGDLRERESYEI